uniref:Uncharacterized protein n=1 Tax=Amphimedon queenslandica TaxID=400682 RepID=A0A1X7T574_AMPQE
MDVSPWSRLLMFPKCILLSPTVAGPRDWKVTLELVRDRLRLWEADRISNSSPSNHSDSKIRRCKRAVEDGQYRKAIQSLSSRGLAPDNNEPVWSTHQDINVTTSHRSLFAAIDKVSFSTLLSQAPDVRSRALVLSSSIPHSGDWLSVVPSRQLGLHFLDQEFWSCVQYWLGFSSGNSPPCAVCSSPLDPFGDHEAGCRGNWDLICCHDSLHDVLFSAAQSAALAPQKEMPSLIPGSCAQPANVFLPHGDGGRPAALDVTVISSLQVAMVADLAVIQGSALGVAEARKLSMHAAACHHFGVNFLPLAVEVLGGWSPSAVSIIRSIGRRLGQRIGRNPSVTCSHLFQHLSVSLWRGNAAMWVQQPSFASHIDGSL